MISFRDLVNGFRLLKVNPHQPVIVHTSLSAFGEEIHGGAPTVLGALLATFGGVMMPTFTYKTMLTPEVGPENNGLVYGVDQDNNRMAEFFRPDLPADRMMGVLPEILRRRSNARRSKHPILSFSGVNVDSILRLQSLQVPLSCIGGMMDHEGWVLLVGVDHTVNTSLHYAELLAGRRQFTRWSLTPQGVYECPGFPGCSDGFEQAAPFLTGVTRYIKIGGALIQAVPIRPMVEIVTGMILKNPLAFLCQRPDCARCNSVRLSVQQNRPYRPGIRF